MIKRSLTIAGHRTSIALEAEFWVGLEAVCALSGRSLVEVIADIDAQRETENLASALRLRVLRHYRDAQPGITRR